MLSRETENKAGRELGRLPAPIVWSYQGESETAQRTARKKFTMKPITQPGTAYDLQQRTAARRPSESPRVYSPFQWGFYVTLGVAVASFLVGIVLFVAKLIVGVPV